MIYNWERNNQSEEAFKTYSSMDLKAPHIIGYDENGNYYLRLSSTLSFGAMKYAVAAMGKELKNLYKRLYFNSINEAEKWLIDNLEE